VRLGALVSGVLTPGESYRLVTKLFLHYGVLHLAMNMLGLIAIGPFVESALGKLRTLFLYLCAGVAGSLLEVLLPGDEPQLFVGASGCIMGLLGATAAVLLFDYRRQGAQPAKSRLGRIGFVLVAQLGFDLTVPNISLYAHWSGVLVGFLLGLGLTRGTGQKQLGNGSRSPGPQTR
jgi:rhomboid protease GluP